MLGREVKAEGGWQKEKVKELTDGKPLLVQAQVGDSEQDGWEVMLKEEYVQLQNPGCGHASK